MALTDEERAILKMPYEERELKLRIPAGSAFVAALVVYRERTGAGLKEAILAFGPCSCGHRGHIGACPTEGCLCSAFATA